MDIISLASHIRNAERIPLEPPEGGGLAWASSDVVLHLQTLLRGVAHHAVEADPNELQRLQQRMTGIAATLKHENTVDDVLVAVSQALRALEDYNRRAAEIFQTQTAELREMLRSMTDTMIFISASSESSVKQLSVVENKIERAAALNDIRQVRELMADTLAVVRSESRRLKKEAKEKTEALTRHIERLSQELNTLDSEPPTDPVTGLPARSAAEYAISTRIASGKEFVLAFYLMDRLPFINGRYGRLVGDEILVTGAQNLAQRLSGAALYRWSGPAFLAIFDATLNLHQVEARARQAAENRLEKNISMEDRSVLLMITLSCLIRRLSSREVPHEVFKSLDGYMAENSGAAGMPPVTASSSAS